MTDFTDNFWDATYRKQIGKMIGICYRYVSNQQVAEDLAHDAFVTAIDKSKSFNGTGSFEAWLRKITVNTALHYLRDKKQEKSFDEYTIIQNNIMESANEDTDIKHQKLIKYSVAELLDKVNKLPEHHRLVFNLYVIDKFSHAQISKKLRISPVTSRSHLARARRKLYEQLLEKPTNKHDRQKKKRILLLFILPSRSKQIDRLYKRSFQKFEIQLNDLNYVNSLNLEQASVPFIKPLIFSLKYLLLSGISIVGILTIVLVIRNDVSVTIQPQKIVADSVQNESDTILHKEIRDTASEIVGKPNNILSTDSVKQSVNRNTTPMRISKVNSKSTENIKEDEPPDPVDIKLRIKEESKEPNTQGNSGTFFATRLIWSKKNNLIRLIGKSSVNYNGRIAELIIGTTVLDRNVHLLSYNGELLEIGASIRIGKKCRIVRLSKEEATEKYGAKGKRGAVEISIIE